MRDPFREGLASGWKHVDASELAADRTFDADVVIVGSGAGGGVTAELLAAAGLEVVIVEEGPLRTSSDFRMRESEAYPDLYQDSASRQTADKAIKILQGRCVGGSTTVNWTSSFRTPPATLQWWQTAHGLKNLSVEAMAPWFAAMEQRLHVGLWPLPPNENNAVLARGAAKLGIPVAVIPRNVKMCWNLGYCGMGCPTNAKQSMLVTTIPAALTRGATLISRLRAEKLEFSGNKAVALDRQALKPDGLHAERRQGQPARPPFRTGRRRHQFTGPAHAQQCRRSAWPARQAHLPASDADFVRVCSTSRCAPTPGRRSRSIRITSWSKLRSTAPGLQIGSSAAAPGSFLDNPARLG